MKSLLFAILLTAPQDADDSVQRNTALVRQYPHVDRLVTKAQSFVKEGRYREALEIYVEAVAGHPNHVVPVSAEKGTPRAATLYVGLQEYCLREVETWPSEGRAAYRAHFDGPARAEFEAARSSRDVAALELLVERYPYSGLTDDALALLGNIHLDRGDPDRAARALERLLSISDGDVPVALTFARLGSAYALLGRAEKLRALAARARRELGAQEVILGGRTETAAAFLEQLAGSVRERPVVATAEVGGWECFLGDASGARIAAATPLGLPAWTTPLEAVEYGGSEDEELPVMGRGRSPPSNHPFFPAVSDGIVYVHNEYSVWAINLYGKSPEVLWSHRLRRPPGTLMFEERLCHSITVHDGRVFANLVTAHGRMETRMQYIHVKFPFPKRTLFAFDAYTGRILWKLGGEPEPQSFADGLTFATAPTAYEGRLYVGGIRQPTSTDPFEHYVLCLDPSTGATLWCTFIASGGTEINLFGNSTRESGGSPVGAAAGSVYYGTNHGAFASLDARTGRLRWLHRYDQLPVNPTRSVNIRRNPLEWSPGAPVIHGEQVFYAPTDARFLTALDVRTGQKRWERPRGDLRHVYGILGDHLVAGGDALEWYDLKGKLAGRFEPEPGRGAGRGALASDGVYFPTTEGLFRIELSGGKRPVLIRWPGPCAGGNVTVADGAILVSDAATLSAFMETADTEEEVRRMIARDPDDPHLLYAASLKLLQSGRAESAVPQFARVLELVSKSNAPGGERLERAARRRLFAVTLQLGRRLLEQGQPARARGFLEQARAAAPGLPEKAEAATRLAGALLALQRKEAAIGELQKIIFEHGEERVNGERLAEAVRLDIAIILKTSGSDAYAKFEAQARALLEEARRHGTPEAHLDIWRRYPNSEAAEEALVLAAEACERAGRVEEAAATCRLLLRQYPASTRVAGVQRNLVLLLERRRQFAAAAVVLRRILKGAADRETIEFCEARLAREEYRTASGTARAVSLELPLERSGGYVERDLPGDFFVVKPRGPVPKSGAGLLLLAGAAQLKAVRPGTGAVEWRVPLDAVLVDVLSHDETLFVVTERSVQCVNPASGAVLWRREDTAEISAAASAGTALCIVTADGRGGAQCTLTALDVSLGTPLWSQACAGNPVAGGLLTVDDQVVLVTAAPQRLNAFNLDSGRREVQRDLPATGGALQVVGAVESTVIVHQERSAVTAFNLSTGKQMPRDIRTFDRVVARLGPAGLFLFGRQRGAGRGLLMDPRTGKLLAVWDIPEPESVRQVEMDEKRIYLLCRPEDGEQVSLRVVTIGDPDTLLVAMPLVVPGGNSALEGQALRLAAGHLVVFQAVRLETGRFDFLATVLDKGGAVVQNIKGDGSYERQVGVELGDPGLVIRTDNRVEVLR